jgi:hypothetical protein
MYCVIVNAAIVVVRSLVLLFAEVACPEITVILPNHERVGVSSASHTPWDGVATKIDQW